MEITNKYLGEEKIIKLLFKFSVPCILGLLISALYNIVDQIFIGNSELGYYGNAATGISFPILCVVNAFAWCIGDGAASYLSICSGRKDSENAHKSVGTGITTTIIIGIFLTIISLIFAAPLMNLFGASSQTLTLATDYYVIISSFFVFYLLLNVMNSMIRADGSPKYAMIAMLLGAILNIILDPLFIYVFKWGIKGAAWATVIGQVVAFLVCACYFIKPKSFVLTKKSFLIDLKVLKNLVLLGASTFITQVSIAILSLVSNMMLAKYGSLSDYGKDIPISVFNIITKVFTIVLNIVVGIILGGQPIFGYNYGAKKFDRVKKTYKIVLLATIIIGLISTLLFQLCPKIIIKAFGSGDELYFEFAEKTFRIYLSLLLVTCLIKMSSIFFQSIGKPVYSVISSIIRDIVIYVPLVFILTSNLENKTAGSGINGILYAAPIADLISVFIIIVLTYCFFKSLNKEEKYNLIED